MRRPQLIGNGSLHCKYNGGSYWVHFRNAFTKGLLALCLGVTGLIHAFFPFLFPDVPDLLLQVLTGKHQSDDAFAATVNAQLAEEEKDVAVEPEISR